MGGAGGYFAVEPLPGGEFRFRKAADFFKGAGGEFQPVVAAGELAVERGLEGVEGGEVRQAVLKIGHAAAH